MRNRRYALALAVILALPLFVVALSAVHGQDSAAVSLDSETARIVRGYQIAPVPLNLRGRDRNLVGLGSYLVNAGGCNDCHTNPSYAEGGDPFKGEPEHINTAGYLAGGQHFGPFTSRNITPDDSGKPAGLTFQQFKTLMRTGVDVMNEHPQLGPLLQVMPWPAFRKHTDRDLKAMYEYLSAIPHIDGGDR